MPHLGQKITPRQLSETALKFNNGVVNRVGIIKGQHHRIEYLKTTQEFMMTQWEAAMRGEWDEKIFHDMSASQRWAVLNYWLKFLMPTSVQLSGEVGIKKIEVSYETLTENRFEQIENKQQSMIEKFNDEEL